MTLTSIVIAAGGLSMLIASFQRTTREANWFIYAGSMLWALAGYFNHDEVCAILAVVIAASRFLEKNR